MSDKDHTLPFMAVVRSPTRPLGTALRNFATPYATSPWSPRAYDACDAPGAPGTPSSDAPSLVLPPTPPTEAELEAMYNEARELGRADGIAETAALRDQLAALLAALDEARDAIIAPVAELVTDVASCVIEAWIENAPRAELFGPLVRNWIQQSAGKPAIVRVHPDDVDALTTAVGDAPITITADPALARGALAIANATTELSHDWNARMPDLRTAIASALEESQP